MSGRICLFKLLHMAKKETEELPKKDIPFAIRAIYLRDSTIRLLNDFDPISQQVNLVGQFRFTPATDTVCQEIKQEDSTIRSCCFISKMDFRYIRTKSDGSTPSAEELDQYLAAEITAEIAADYQIISEEFPPKTELEKWSSNALMHVWPFWREYCQNSMMRLALPVTIIPLLNIVPPDTKKD